MDLRIYAGSNDLTGVVASVAVGVAPALPLVPVHVGARRDAASGDVTMVWTRCSRADANGWGPGEAPLEQVPERYGLQISDGGTLVRSIECDGPLARYAAADQIADFGALPAAFDFTIAQVSPIFGPGHAAGGTFHG